MESELFGIMRGKMHIKVQVNQNTKILLLCELEHLHKEKSGEFKKVKHSLRKPKKSKKFEKIKIQKI
jgi:hypothetical protein